jgi:Lrp/AsnC family transcriptional regulator for asnA, asnC and gidA
VPSDTADADLPAAGDATILDDTDKALIRALRDDPQTPNNRLAAIVGASEMTIARRLRRLVGERLIKVTVQRDMRLLGYATIAFADIDIEGVAAKTVGKAIAAVPEAYSVSYTLGHPQIIAMIMARDSAHVFEIVNEKIATISGVRQARMTIALRMLNHRSGIAAL